MGQSLTVSLAAHVRWHFPASSLLPWQPWSSSSGSKRLHNSGITAQRLIFALNDGTWNYRSASNNQSLSLASSGNDGVSLHLSSVAVMDSWEPASYESSVPVVLSGCFILLPWTCLATPRTDNTHVWSNIMEYLAHVPLRSQKSVLPKHFIIYLFLWSAYYIFIFLISRLIRYLICFLYLCGMVTFIAGEWYIDTLFK